jgi:hypothetical protein
MADFEHHVEASPTGELEHHDSGFTLFGAIKHLVEKFFESHGLRVVRRLQRFATSSPFHSLPLLLRCDLHAFPLVAPRWQSQPPSEVLRVNDAYRTHMRSDGPCRPIEDATLHVHRRVGGESQSHRVGGTCTDDASIATRNRDNNPRRGRGVVPRHDDDVVDAAAKLPDDAPKLGVRLGLFSLNADALLAGNDPRLRGP